MAIKKDLIELKVFVSESDIEKVETFFERPNRTIGRVEFAQVSAVMQKIALNAKDAYQDVIRKRLGTWEEICK